MKLGQKIIIVEDNLIGVVHEIDPVTGQPTKAKVGDKIIDIAGKTIKIITWVMQIISFLKQFIKF